MPVRARMLDPTRAFWEVRRVPDMARRRSGGRTREACRGSSRLSSVAAPDALAAPLRTVGEWRVDAPDASSPSPCGHRSGRDRLQHVSDQRPSSAPPRIAVRGIGRARRTPDIADLTLVVEVIRPTATEARDGAARTARQVTDALRAAGVTDEDLRTAGIDIQPAWESDAQGRSRRSGFTVLHRVAARVREVDAVGRSLDAALDAAAPGVDLVQLGIGDPREAETEARRLAVADAQARAATIAEAAGASLGPLLAIAEGVSLEPPS